MSVSVGYKDLQPNSILGSDKVASAAARQMVGSEFDLPNQLSDHFPFYPMADSERIVVPRVAELGTSQFLDGTTKASDSSQSVLEDPPEIIDVTSIVGDSVLTDYARNLLSGSIDQHELHVQFKVISARILFWTQFFRPRLQNGFRGLPDLVSRDQTIGNVGDLSLEALDDLVGKVTEADMEMDRKVIVMRSETFKTFARLVRRTESPLTYAVKGGRRYAIHNGVPILVCDYIPMEKPKGKSRARMTSVWCCTLGYEDNGLFGVFPPNKGSNGLVVEKVTGGKDTDGATHRVRWYASIALAQTRGLAVLTDVLV